MASIITKAEFKYKYDEMVKAWKSMDNRPTTLICEKCYSLYSSDHRTYCYCDYESDYYYESCNK